MVRTHRQFTLRQLFLIVTVFAVLFALLGSAPLTIGQIAVAVLIVVGFAAIDLRQGWTENPQVRLVYRGTMFIAHYATAFVLSTAASLLVWICFPPQTPPQPLLSFLVEFWQDLTAAITIMLVHVCLFALLSTVGFVAALISLRGFRTAFIFLFACFPGTALLLYDIVSRIVHSFQSR